MLIGIIIVIVLIHFLIIRPLTRRNRPEIYEPRRQNYNGRQDYYGPNNSRNMGGMGGFGGMSGQGMGGPGMGRFSTFAGGLATGALLTYLFEQGRIGFDQFQYMQNMQDHELLRELEDQNILQQDEIDQLRDEMGSNPDDGSQDDAQDNQDYNDDPSDYGSNDDQDNNDSDSWGDDSDDNWV